MRTVLLGDSHLARVRRDLNRLGPDVVNAAVGGATADRLCDQARGVPVGSDDIAVVSIGTNDAAPGRGLAPAAYAAALDRFLTSVRPARIVLVTSPGVVVSRLGTGDRTPAILAEYAATAAALFLAEGATIISGAALVGPLGDSAFASDGLHLSGAGYNALLPALAEAVSATD